MEGSAPKGGEGKGLWAAWTHQAGWQQIMSWFHGTDQTCILLAVSWAGYFRA